MMIIYGGTERAMSLEDFEDALAGRPIKSHDPGAGGNEVGLSEFMRQAGSGGK